MTTIPHHRCLAPFLALALALPATITSLQATTRYVNGNHANAAWPYTSWDSAATTIQDAVDAAAAGDEIVVTNGLYATGGRAVGTNLLVNRVAVDKPLTVRSVNGPEFTVIKGYQVPGTTNGDGAVRCVYLVSGATLSGFTLTNGATRVDKTNYQFTEECGGGVWCASTNAMVTNCVLTGNSAANSGGGAFGGTLNHCTLTGNWAYVGCGAAGSAAVYDWSSPADDVRCILNHCTLTGNSNPSAAGGGAADLSKSGLGCTLNNCIVAGNRAGEGGGADHCTLNNCTVVGNAATSQGGGVVGSTLNNCTVIGNTAARCGGVSSSGTGILRPSGLINCIVYYNTAPESANYDLQNRLSYCCTTPLAGGVGNIEAEPQLASAMRLSASSPCLGAGSFAAVTGVDIDGEPWANPPAMGCDQYYSASLTGAVTVAALASYTNVAVGFSVDFQALISGRVSASRWEFGDGTVLSNRPFASHGWSVAGDFPVVLRAYNHSNPAGVTATVTVHVVTQPIHYVALGSSAPAVPYGSWATAATNIQDAVDASSVVGAMVLVSNGVYATGGRAMVGTMTNRVAVHKPLTLRSVNGPQFTVIQGQQVPFTINGDGAVRCVYLTNGASLSGFTLTNGATRSSTGDPNKDPQRIGGGVLSEPGAAVSNCVIAGNAAWGYGGGVVGGTLKNCTLTANSAGYGAGAYRGTLTNCTLTGNVAGLSGGGAVDSTLFNCTLTGNSTAKHSGGGAIGCALYHCTLSGNAAGTLQFTAGIGGGGAANAVLFNCTVTNNWSYADGGGVYGVRGQAYGYSGFLCRLYNCTISGNQCNRRGGGAFYCELNNCAVTRNSAGWYGGGAYASALNHCTVLGNSAVQFGGGVVGEPPDPGCTGCIGHPCVMYNSIVYSNTAPAGANHQQTNIFNFSCTTPRPAAGVGNITSAPLFVDYSGGNLRLQSNSPGINAGNNAYVVGSTDLDGRPRIVGANVDLGAYEFQSASQNEFIVWLQKFSLPADGSADYADADGDGHNNWQEWRCLSDPTNVASVLRLYSPVFTPPGLLLRWSSDASRTYGVERATSLTPPLAFSLLQSNIAGLPSTTTFTDTRAPLPGAAFYRIRADSTNAVLPLVLQAPAFVPASLTLCWSSVTNRTYILERSTNPAAPPTFSLLQSNIIGQAGTTTYTDTNALGAGPFFYRVGVQN